MAAPALARGKTGRRYVWPPGTDNPEMVVPSVTTILDQLSKPALPAWAAREVATYAVTHIDAWRGLDARDAIDLLKRAPYRNMREKGDIGTAVHTAVEAWTRTPMQEPPEVGDLGLLPYIAGAVEFLNHHVAQVLHSEATVFNRRFQYAGTCDLIATLTDGRNAVIDWKTGNNLYPEVALQLAAYAHGDFIGHQDGTEQPLPPIHVGVAVHLPGDATYKARQIELTDRLFRTFVALRTLQRWRDDYEADALGPELPTTSGDVTSAAG